MMHVIVQEQKPGDAVSLVITLDDSFVVESILVPYVNGRHIRYTIEPVPAYEKSYRETEASAGDDAEESMPAEPASSVFWAMTGERAAGKLAISVNWNRYGYIHEITVDRAFRRQGIARRLLQHAVCWAKARGLPGLMLETQNNNVPACLLYASCGFVLGGIDLHLYRGLDPESGEIALHWYLLFEEPTQRSLDFA